MSDIAIGTSSKDDATQAEPTKRSRILRYDQVYDVYVCSSLDFISGYKLGRVVEDREELANLACTRSQKSQVRLIKSIKPEIKKQRGRKLLLIVRRLVDDKGLHTKTEVDIKSSRVAQVMQEINADVEDVSLKTKPPVVPLEIFYHSKLALQDTLDKAMRAEPRDDDLVADLTETTKFAVEEYATTTANLAPLLDAGEITWELLWTIFPPNVLVYRYHRLVEQDQILKLRAIRQTKRQNKSRYWELRCRIVTNDGVKFGQAYEPFSMEIEEFAGARKITDLRVFPLSYHTETAKIREAIIIRGRRFAGLSEARVMETSGPAMFEKRDNAFVSHQYNFTSYGRTIIDPVGFRSFNPSIEFMPDVNKGLSQDNLTDEELLICSPFAVGFCFGNKKWGAFAMSRLLDVKWNSQAFQDLVMDKPAKTLVYSMVKQHSSQDGTFDDIISGKGKGIVALFSGSPGSGKTLTAEAVAEITKRPLYSVSAGDLGIDPNTVNRRLSEILEQSQKWNAVLLLDEADVFLQQRNQNDVKRNALVCIFLRQLEYYQGILIMTTNRITQCDIAFESRMHISLHYPDLVESTRRQIWMTFLKRLKETQHSAAVDISDDDVSRLAKIEVNGRQIKNICSSARIMAKEMDEVLSMSHFKLVLSIINLGFKVEPLATQGTNSAIESS